MKLSTKLPLLLVGLAVVPIIVVSSLAYYNGGRTIEQETADHLKAVNILKKSEIDRWVESGKKSLQELAQRPLVRQYASLLSQHGEAHARTKARLIQNHLQMGLKFSHFQELSVLCPSHGIILASTNSRQEGKLRDNRPFFLQGRERTYVQDIYYSAVLEEPTMTIGTPIRDDRENLLAVLAGRLDLGELSTIMEQGRRLRATEDTYLVNAFNFFVTEPRFGQGYALKEHVHTQGVDACLSGKDGMGLYNDYRGEPVIGAYNWLEDYNMGLITEIDQAVAFRPIHRLAWFIALAALAIIGATAGLSLSFARSITRPIHQLLTGTQEVGRGNLSYRVGTSTGDEIGALSRAFDRMSHELQRTTVSRDEIVRLNEELEQRVAERTAELERKAAQLQAANKELEAFAYSVSHDLRAPLRAIDGYTRILEEDYHAVLDEEGHRVVGVICSEAERLGSLIDALLSYSRLGRAELSYAQIDMSSLVRSVFHEVTTPEERQRIDFQVEDLPGIQGDPALIRQVWMNLMSNAVKYSSKREHPAIQVAGEQRGREALYLVRDNGAGFEMQYVDKLFGVFQRLHSSREFEGTGVGLANVQRAVLRHGGRVWAEGEPGRGAVFGFALPVSAEGSKAADKGLEAGAVPTRGLQSTAEQRGMTP